MMNDYPTTLVIGDAHDSPHQSQERFEALGSYIEATRPDNIVQIGDWGTYDSISFHNKGRPLLQEGARLSDDVESAKRAYHKMMAPLRAANSKYQMYKKRQYAPNIFWLEANHEYRIKRFLMEHPALVGTLREDDLVGAANDGATLVPYRSYCYINGVAFTHIPCARRSSTTLGGEYVTKKAADGHDTTVVFGHTHRFLIHDGSRIRERGQNLCHAINVGWFGDYVPDYVESEANLDWWSGLVILWHVGEGQVDVETISMGRLKAAYL
jgi:hypothetical protein